MSLVFLSLSGAQVVEARESVHPYSFVELKKDERNRIGHSNSRLVLDYSVLQSVKSSSSASALVLASASAGRGL